MQGHLPGSDDALMSPDPALRRLSALSARRAITAWLALGILGAASAQLYGSPQSGEEAVKGLLERVDGQGRVIVQNRVELRESQAGEARQVEYLMTMTEQARTLSAANQAIQAWWTYQDRSRWIMSIRANGSMMGRPNPLNIPGAYSTACLLGIGKTTDAKFPRASVQTTTMPQWFTPGYQKPGHVNFEAWDDKMDLPSTLPVFQTPLTPTKEHCPKEAVSDFQDDLLGTPGLKRQFYLTGMKVCLFASGPCATSKDFPEPQKIDWNEMKRRQEEACKVIENEYKTYRDALEGARNAASPLPGQGAWWNDNNYFWVAPVRGEAAGNTRAQDLINQLLSLAPHATRYYDNAAQAVGKPSAEKSTLKAGDYTQVTNQPDQPGIVHLEEYKRFWPPLDAQSSARRGVASFFQLWTSPELVTDNKIQQFQFYSRCAFILPEPGLCTPSVPKTSGLIHDVVIAPGGRCTVLPTRMGTMTFSDQPHYRWVSVPEGYLIPDVRGVPRGATRP